jgi:uncharacterized protein
MIWRVRNAVVVGAMAFSAFVFGQSAQQLAEQASRQAASAPAITADQQPSPEQLAKLFEVMRIKQQMASMRTMVPSMVQQQIQSAVKQTEEDLPQGTKLTAEQREKMQAVMNKYVGKAMDLYPADEMMTDMSAIYQKHLSKDDVDALIAFYSSPAGQHLLDAQPAIAQEYMPVVMGKVAQRSQAMTKEMMAEMAEIVPEMKPSGAKPAAAGKPAAKTGTTKPPAN